MKKRILLLCATLLFSGGASAADLIVEEPPPVYVAPLYDWNGFYVGVNAGIGGGTFEHPFTLDACLPEEVGCIWETLATGSADVTAFGFVGGIQGGYNWQWDENFLLGIEGDIQGSTIDGRVSLSITDELGIIGDPGDTFEADLGTSLDWFATIRPRIGWVNDRFVVYGTGGLAWGQTTSSINASIAGVDIFEELDIDNEVTNDRFGWTIGAGIEYALTDNITLKTEYLYTDLGSEEIINIGDDETFEFTADSTVAFHTLRAGLNFQF